VTAFEATWPMGQTRTDDTRFRCWLRTIASFPTLKSVRSSLADVDGVPRSNPRGVGDRLTPWSKKAVMVYRDERYSNPAGAWVVSTEGLEPEVLLVSHSALG
jgi:hypothetical protein